MKLDFKEKLTRVALEGILKRFIFFTLLFLCQLTVLKAQEFRISGKVTDGENGEGVPFAVIFLKGSTIGTTTDFEGNFSFKVRSLKDSLIASCVGYVSRAKKLKNTPEQVVNFTLFNSATALNEVEVRPGENPAWEIMRRVISNKDRNDKRKIDAYEYESYSKVEVDIDNISRKMREKKLMKKILTAIDSIGKLADDDGKKIIPVFISETMSNVYYRENPVRHKENIVATKVTGVGVQDGSFISQLVGTSFQDYNFYKNWVQVANKQFISPITDAWKSHYQYELSDSMYIGEDLCYRINFKPKNVADLAFKGVMYITKNGYALKQVDMATDKNTNLNFIEKLKIQQELVRTDEGPWYPKKVRIVVDVADLSDSTAGLIAKFYISNNDFKIGIPRPTSFYDNALEVAEDHTEHNEKYWQEHRHDSLSSHDKAVYKLVDTLKKLPVVRTYIEAFDIIINGYKRLGKFDLGPYLETMAINDIEGYRLKLGFKTNHLFSNRWVIRGYLAYGTKDEKVKYSMGTTYIVSKKKWTYLGADHFFDLEQLALFSNFRVPGAGLFYALARFGNIDKRSPFYIHNTSIYGSSEFVKGITGKLTFNYAQMNSAPVSDPYRELAYYVNPGTRDSTTSSTINNAEIVFELRMAREETYLIRDNARISTGAKKLPIVTMRFHQGIKGLLNSNFNYQKFTVNLYQKINLGRFGYSTYSLTGTKIFGNLPYPLLNVYLGNPTVVYNPVGFSMMRFFEFVSDQTVTLNYQHHFNGYFFNKIPLFKRLKWREVISSNIAWGTMSKENQDIIPEGFRKFHVLDPHIPYVDVGYGIENIFKFLRVEFYQRLDYLNNKSVGIIGASRFGIKVGAQFTL